MILVTRAPHEQSITRIVDVKAKVVVEKRFTMRSNPYPPNFRRMAARIMEPATGASTWALGSHR